MLVNVCSFTQGVVNRLVLCQLSSFTCIVAGMCVMVGCDFLPSIRAVGVRQALLTKHGELQGAHVLPLLSLCTSVFNRVMENCNLKKVFLCVGSTFTCLRWKFVVDPSICRMQKLLFLVSCL